jgi:DNA repair protein RadC
MPSHNHVAETISTFGAETLSDIQLLASLLNLHGAKRAELLLRESGNLGQLLQLGPAQLRGLGLSGSEVSRLAAVPEFLRRINRQLTERPRLTSPRLAGAYLIPRCTGWTEERFGLLALNAKAELLAERILSQGTATATLISPREFFREALRFGATTAIAWHNHPSGDPTPSREDSLLTKRLRESGESLGVPLSDHIIVGWESYHSFRAAEGWDCR